MDRKQRLRAMRLYALLTEEHCRRPWLDTSELLLDGGADVIQLREKALGGGELLSRARMLRQLTDRFSALLIINDRPDVAILGGADGVHLGQADLPVEDVRRMVGPEMIIGVSTHTPEQAAEAEGRGADYVGVGPAFPTATKGYREGGGPELVSQLCKATALPTVVIGSVNPANARSLLDAGAQAVAACAALCGAVDPREAARSFLRVFEKR